MKKTMLASTVVFALSLVLAAVPVNQALAACGPIDPAFSEWELAGSMKASVKKVSKVKLPGQVDLDFQSSAFQVYDPEGQMFYGIYTFDAKGKVQLEPQSPSLRSYIGLKIESMAAAAGHAVYYDNLRDISCKASAKVKSVKTGVTLSVSIRIRATADISVDDQPAKKTNISISFKAKDTKVMSVANTRWWMTTKLKASVKGLGKGTDTGTLDVIFGPKGGVPANKFEAIDDEANVFTGPYTVDTKGRVIINPDWGELAAYLEDLIESESEGDAWNVSVNITKVTCVAKVKHAMSITMKLSVKFTVECDVTGGHVSGKKGSYSQKGKGCATEYEL